MAKFGENVFEYTDIQKFRQIPVTLAEDQWLITSGKCSVMKVQDYKILHTWTMMHRHLHYFKTPVAYSNGSLFVVMDGETLLKWSLDEDIIEKGEKVQLQNPVFTMFSLPEAPIIIFETGNFAVVDNNSFSQAIFKPPNFISVKKTHKILWADVTVSDTAIEIFYIAHDKKGGIILYYFKVNKEDKSVSTVHTYDFPHGPVFMKSRCLNYQDLSVLTLWSNGTVQNYNVKDSKDTVLFTIPDVNDATIVDMNIIDSTHIVVVKGKEKATECVLEVWDYKAVILKGRKHLKTPLLNNLQVVAMDDHIFINFLSKLIAFPFEVDTSFFATLNTSKPTEFQQHSWNADLELVPIPASDEPEAMDTSPVSDNEDAVKMIIEKVLKKDSADLMFIPESELVKLLQLVISCKKNENSGQGCFGKEMYALLNIIFSASYNDSILVKYLKRMNVEDTLIALEFLLSYLKHNVNIPADVQRPTELQITNWTSAIITSHTEALLFMKEKTVKKLLRELNKTLSAQLEEYEEMNEVLTYFYIIKKKNIIMPQQNLEKYSIETLNL